MLLLRFKPRMGLDDTLAFDFSCGGERLIALCSPPPASWQEAWRQERHAVRCRTACAGGCQHAGTRAYLGLRRVLDQLHLHRLELLLVGRELHTLLVHRASACPSHVPWPCR